MLMWDSSVPSAGAWPGAKTPPPPAPPGASLCGPPDQHPGPEADPQGLALSMQEALICTEARVLF